MNIDKRAYGETSPEKDGRTIKIINLALLFAVLVAIGILCWALPQKTYSEYERRDLAQMPEFSVTTLFAGKYTAGVETAFADTFAYRDEFVRMRALIEEARGIRVDDVAIYGTPSTGEESEGTESGNSEESQPETPSSGTSSETTESGSSSSETETVPDDGATGETVNSIFVYKGMGFELLGVNKKVADKYAAVINEYREALPSGVNLYCMVVPKHSEFALPQKYQSLNASAKTSIDGIYSQLESGVTAVDVYSVLKEHSSEYIYFNTDHHWTGLGAYYAYTKFMESAGLQSYSYDSYTKHIIEDFRGTLYAGTQDSSIYNNPDYVEWCEFPVSATAYQYNKGDLSNYYETTVMASYAKGSNAYGVYLGGDFPLTIIKTNVGNGRKCVIIKESYGNAPSTYIASGFEETYIVDERYYEGNIVDLITSRGITDVLIINNVSAANTAFHVNNVEALLTNTYTDTISYPD